MTVTHNRGNTNYNVGMVLTSVPVNPTSLSMINKTANTFDVQGVTASALTGSMTFDWIAL